MVAVQDLQLRDGRILRVYDCAEERAATLTLLWHHGSPQTGAPLGPLLAAAAERDIRLVSYGRPSYGGSSPQPGRSVAAAASDVAQIATALDLARFTVMGASGGGPHALACAALLPEQAALNGRLRKYLLICCQSVRTLADSAALPCGSALPMVS